MARGDIFTVIVINMTNGDTTDRQPASGVEELLMDVGDVSAEGTTPDVGPAVEVRRVDGTNNDSKLAEGDVFPMATAWFRMKMVADNTNFFRVIHQGGTGDYTFSTIEIG